MHFWRLSMLVLGEGKSRCWRRGSIPFHLRQTSNYRQLVPVIIVAVYSHFQIPFYTRFEPAPIFLRSKDAIARDHRKKRRMPTRMVRPTLPLSLTAADFPRRLVVANESRHVSKRPGVPAAIIPKHDPPGLTHSHSPIA
jgi:hypothetical protein